MAGLPGMLPRRATGVELDFTFLVNRAGPIMRADLSWSLSLDYPEASRPPV